jgi:hypothetical protein
MLLVATLITPTIRVIVAAKVAVEHRESPEEEIIGNSALNDNMI